MMFSNNLGLSILLLSSSAILISLISLNGFSHFPLISYVFAQQQQNQQQVQSIPSSPLPSSQEEQKQIRQQQSAWSTAVNMTTSRSEITGDILNGKIYVIGGVNATGKNLAIVETYDPIKDQWITVAPLPESRDHAAAAAYNSKLYVVGGYDGMRKPSNKLFIYDPAINKWQEGKPMPTARGALTAQFVNGILYAIGGNSSMPLNANEAYDPQSTSWTQKAPMLTARHHIASSIVNGKIYVFGGRQLDNSSRFVVTVNTNEMYDPQKNTWTALEPMPSNRGGIAASNSSNGHIYVFGGEHPPGSIDTIRLFYNNEKYDPKTNKWTSEPPMLTARHGLVALTIGDKIYVIGGGVKPGLSVSKTNEVFHIQTS
jgi:N-acetylneuraminic acid mutarotase